MLASFFFSGLCLFFFLRVFRASNARCSLQAAGYHHAFAGANLAGVLRVHVSEMKAGVLGVFRNFTSLRTPIAVAWKFAVPRAFRQIH